MSNEGRAKSPGDETKGTRELTDEEFNWEDAPVAPPFQVAPGSMYPQMYQIPMSYFTGIPYYPQENFGEETTYMEENRQTAKESAEVHSFNPYYYPYQTYPYYGYSQPYTDQFADREPVAGYRETGDPSIIPNEEDSRQVFPVGFPFFWYGFPFHRPFFHRPFYPYYPFFPFPRPRPRPFWGW